MLERIRNRVTGSLLLWDLILTLLCLTIALQFSPPSGIFLTSSIYVTLYAVVAVVWVTIFMLLVPQRALFVRGLVEAIGRLVASIGLSAASFAGVLYLISFTALPRSVFLLFVGLNLMVLVPFHLIVRSYIRFRHRNGWQRRTLVVGDPSAGNQIAQEFSRRPWTGLQVVGYTSDEDISNDSMIPRLGTIAQTIQLVNECHIDEVIFALPPHQHAQVEQLSLALLQQPVMLHMVPSVLDLAFARTPVSSIGGIPLVSLRESALSDSQRILKRMFDIFASGLLLLLLSPVMLVLAFLIKIESPGPVLFLQERIGEHGRRFRMFKFRSMYQDADKRWHEVAKRDENGNLIHKVQDDPRVTRVGRKLRRTSLDELPQLINVLRGEMSLVGPRPEMPYIAAEYEPWQWQRFRVPPGITGWWQVNGRSDKPMHLHTEDDIYYIQNYSFWLDIRILFKTLLVVFQGHGAY